MAFPTMNEHSALCREDSQRAHHGRGRTCWRKRLPALAGGRL